MDYPERRIAPLGIISNLLRLSAAAVLGITLAGCGGWELQAGLANAPNINRPWTDEDSAHDAISNGGESCPPSGRPEDDPLLRRIPSCASPIAAPSARPAPRPGPIATPAIP